MNKNKNKILIVDDVELNRAILSELFISEYEVLEADNGKTAVELMEDYRDDVAIVLMDIVMPIMNGLEALEIMNAKGLIEKVPVFLITAESSNEAISKGFKLGVVDVILKPFNPDNICQRVNNIIELYSHRYELETLVKNQMEKIEAQNEQLRNFNVAMIDVLSTVVEFRDCESGQHVHRVRKMTKTLLKVLGSENPKYWMSDEAIDNIADAAALHDIGKIAIPDRILKKPGKLDPEEFEIMKKHTLFGCEILETIDSLKQNKEQYQYCYNICRWHHEKWDGKGYPDGVSGDEIPIYAQIVSIADCYDALTTDRCYKKAFAHQKAVSMIKNGECGTFNPELLQCFLEISDSLPTILESGDDLTDLKNNYRQASQSDSPEKKPQCESDFNRIIHLLEIEREKQEALFSMSGDIIFDYDVQKDKLTFSDEFKEVFGGECVIDGARAYLRRHEILVESDYQAIRGLYYAMSEENREYTKEIRMINKAGEEVWYRIYSTSIWDKERKNVLLNVLGRLVSIDNMKREINQWKKQAESDHLTKLGNRAYGQQMLSEMTDTVATIMYIDIDNFKMVNDQHGHLFGDEVLYRIAEAIKEPFRAYDAICRLGGDEFMVIMRYSDDKETALLKANDIRAGIEKIAKDIDIPMSASIGMSFYPLDGTDTELLLNKADKALYQAKKSGKNACVIYTDEIEEESFSTQITKMESEK